MASKSVFLLLVICCMILCTIGAGIAESESEFADPKGHGHGHGHGHAHGHKAGPLHHSVDAVHVIFEKYKHNSKQNEQH